MKIIIVLAFITCISAAEQPQQERPELHLKKPDNTLTNYKKQLTKIQQKGLIGCDLCRTVLDPLWKGKQFRKILFGGLEKLCDNVPKPADSGRCHKALHDYGPNAIEYIVHKYTPQHICDKLELCTGVDKESRDSSLKCEGCKLGVGLLDSMLTNGDVQHDLITLLDDQVCNALSDNAQKQECKYIVNTYGSAMLNALAKLLGPELLCVETGACKEAKV